MNDNYDNDNYFDNTNSETNFSMDDDIKYLITKNNEPDSSIDNDIKHLITTNNETDSSMDNGIKQMNYDIKQMNHNIEQMDCDIKHLIIKNNETYTLRNAISFHKNEIKKCENQLTKLNHNSMHDELLDQLLNWCHNMVTSNKKFYVLDRKRNNYFYVTPKKQNWILIDTHSPRNLNYFDNYALIIKKNHQNNSVLYNDETYKIIVVIKSTKL